MRDHMETPGHVRVAIDRLGLPVEDVPRADPPVSACFLRLRDRMVEVFGGFAFQLDPETPIVEALPDSLDRFELILLVEESGIELTDQQVEDARTLGDLAALIEAGKDGT